MPIYSEAQTRLPLYFSRKGREKAECTAFAQGHILHVPLISDALAQIECLTTQIQMSGDHPIVVGLVEGAQTRVGKPLLYFAGKNGSFAPL
jgi:flavin reductase ActVB